MEEVENTATDTESSLLCTPLAAHRALLTALSCPRSRLHEFRPPPKKAEKRRVPVVEEEVAVVVMVSTGREVLEGVGGRGRRTVTCPCGGRRVAEWRGGGRSRSSRSITMAKVSLAPKKGLPLYDRPSITPRSPAVQAATVRKLQ